MIEISNIKPGMVVTVLKWTARPDRSYVGDELKVKAVAPPFIKVYRLKDTLTLNIDTREVLLTELPESFVNPPTEDEFKQITKEGTHWLAQLVHVFSSHAAHLSRESSRVKETVDGLLKIAGELNGKGQWKPARYLHLKDGQYYIIRRNYTHTGPQSPCLARWDDATGWVVLYGTLPCCRPPGNLEVCISTNHS